MATNGKHTISNLAELEALFPEEVYPPARVKETTRITNAYRVPAVRVGGLAKFAVKNPPEPLEKPGMVAVARSAPVGRSLLVALIDTVMFGVVPVHPEQNRSRSALVN